MTWARFASRTPNTIPDTAIENSIMPKISPALSLPAATTAAPGTSAAGAEAPGATASAGGAADCVPRRGTRPTRAPATAHP